MKIGFIIKSAKVLHYMLFAASSVDKNVGGQAVIEGVMMKSPERVATSVRLPNGAIVTKADPFVSLTRRYKAFGYPIIRGVMSFFELMVLGIKTLNYSAEMAANGQISEQVKPSSEPERIGFSIAMAVVISLALGLVIFFFLPILTTQLLIADRKAMGFNLVAGAIRVMIFLGYVWVLSQFKDFRRLFQYHGAEHKSIFAFEADLPLVVESTYRFKTYHPRCGTSFILIVAILAIITYSISDTLFAVIFNHAPNIIARFATHLVFLPLVAGVSFELLKLSGKTRNNIITKILIAPGLWIQRITTSEPSDEQVEVAMTALKSSIEGTALDPKPA